MEQSVGIAVVNRQQHIKIDRKAVALFCAGLLRAAAPRNCTMSVALVGVRGMRMMNRRYRGRDYATDVLSFSYGGVKMEGAPFLGEILVSPAVAVDQAARHGADPEKELRKLLVHGTLHLLGYDHETDRGRMLGLQAKLMRRKFFYNPPALIQWKAKR